MSLKKEQHRFHLTTYSNGEKVIDLQRQLFLLREALIRTTHHPSYYPDLFRALRVLIADDGRERLKELSDLTSTEYYVNSRPFAQLGPRDEGESDILKQRKSTSRKGLVSVILPNNYSRWLAIRGYHPEVDESPIQVDFWQYVTNDLISYKMEFGAEITRKDLICEVSNTRGVAHSSPYFSTFLKFTNALSVTGPYFLEIAQDLAYETLTYGNKVLNVCFNQYSNQVAEAIKYETPIPTPQCLYCKFPLPIDLFICPQCYRSQLSSARIISLSEQLTSLFYFGNLIEWPEGTMPLNFNRRSFYYPGITEYTLLDLTVGKKYMHLKRTSDNKLSWTVGNDLSSLTAAWDINELPDQNSITITLMWKPGKVMISALSKRGGKWIVGSDGSFVPYKIEQKGTKD